MTNNSKDIVQYSSACALMASGVILIFLCFFQCRTEFKDFSLGYMGMVLAFGGAVFGIAKWTEQRMNNQDSKITELKKIIDNQISK